MKNLFKVALTLAALAATGTAPVLAGTWSAGISARNIRPYVQTPSINDSGYRAYAQVPATIHQMVHDYSATVPYNGYSVGYGQVPSSLGPVDRFGSGSQR